MLKNYSKFFRKIVRLLADGPSLLTRHYTTVLFLSIMEAGNANQQLQEDSKIHMLEGLNVKCQAFLHMIQPTRIDLTHCRR